MSEQLRQWWQIKTYRQIGPQYCTSNQVQKWRIYQDDQKRVQSGDNAPIVRMELILNDV